MSERQAATAKADPLTPDICVIGAGAAGLALASAAAVFGVQVVLIERGAMGGSRSDSREAALRAVSAQARAMRKAPRFGISPGEFGLDYTQIRAHVLRASMALAANDTAERLGALGVTVISGEARFISRGKVVAGDRTIAARRFVIATGSKPVVPDIPGLDAITALTRETLLDPPRLPDRLIVLGQGSTGVELAQMMAQLGSAVTLVETGRLLADEDAEASALVRRELMRQGIGLHEQACVTRAEARRGGIRLTLAAPDGSDLLLDGSHLLIATGRSPDLEALDLDMAGITSDAGGVVVDGGLRTRNRRVFAIGDCAGAAHGLRGSHVATHQAGLVLRSALFRLPARNKAAAIPHVVHCDPEVASVGLSEAQARKAGRFSGILRWSYAENDRGHADLETEGFLKIITGRKGQILGATLVGARAGELIAPWCIAVQRGLSAKDMAGLVLPSQTLSEASTRVAMSFFAPMAAKPGLRRLIGFLRRLG